LIDTSAFSALEAFWRLLRYISLLTYLVNWNRPQKSWVNSSVAYSPNFVKIHWWLFDL